MSQKDRAAGRGVKRADGIDRRLPARMEGTGRWFAYDPLIGRGPNPNGPGDLDRIQALARTSHQIVVAALAPIGAGLASAAFVFVRAGWFGDEPTFRWDGKHSFTCYLDRELRFPTLSASFSDNGKRAVIHFPDRDATTTFHRGGLAGDVFYGDGIKLVVDPEAYVTGHGNQSIGLCQQD